MPATPWGPYPWDPGGAWDPSAQPAAQAAGPPDTSARDALVAQYAKAHGGLIGSPTTVYDKPTAAQTNAATSDQQRQALKQSLDSGFDGYTFADGTTIELSQDGQARNYKLGSPPTAQQTQLATGTIDMGANGVWVKQPDGTYGPSVDTQNRQQLAGGQTVAQTGLYGAQAGLAGAQGGLYGQQASVVAPNAAAQQALQNAQAGLYGQQANVVGGNALAQQTLQNAQAGLYGQQAGVVGSNAAAQQALQAAQSGLYGQQAGVVQGNAAAQQAVQNAQAGLYGTQAQLAPITAQAQAAQALQQANLYGAQAGVVGSNAQAQQNLYGAQAANQQAQAAAAMNPAQLTVNLTGQANQQYQALQQLVQQGKLSSDAAAGQFDKWYSDNIEPMKQQVAYQQAVQQQALTTQGAQSNLYNAQAANYPATLAQNASSDAQKNLISMMPYVVGAGAGSNPGVTTGANGFPKIDAGQIMQNATYSLPNLQEIGRQGAAAALAGVSPTAQMHAQMPGPPGQPPVQGLPDLNSMLNMNRYGFGPPPGLAPQQGAAPAPGQPQPGAPAQAPFDWAGLLQRQQQSAAEQGIQAGLPGQPTPPPGLPVPPAPAPGVPGLTGTSVPWGQMFQGGIPWGQYTPAAA